MDGQLVREYLHRTIISIQNIQPILDLINFDKLNFENKYRIISGFEFQTTLIVITTSNFTKTKLCVEESDFYNILDLIKIATISTPS